MKKIFRTAAVAAFLCAAVFFSVFPFSCKMTEEGIVLLSGDLVSPKINSWSVAGSNSLELRFSEKVKMNEVAICVAGNAARENIFDRDGMDFGDGDDLRDGVGFLDADKIYPEVQFYDDGKTVVVKSQEALAVGKKYELYAEIEDVAGNTLNFAVPFLGYNSRVPKIAIFAVHPKYSSSKRNGETVYKNEFVELYVATAGNLAGVKIVSAVDGEAKSFTLPPLEVKAGTFVTVHMRRRGDGCVSETPENLRLCRQEYASDTSLDLWSQNAAACLGDSADIITLVNTADGVIIDAVAYAPGGSDEWATDKLLAAAENAVAAGVWDSAFPKNAVCSDDLTASKMIVRTDGKKLSKGAAGTGGSKNWAVAQVVSGSGKNRTTNLGKFVFN